MQILHVADQPFRHYVAGSKLWSNAKTWAVRATLSSLRACRTLKTVVKCKFWSCPSDPFSEALCTGRTWKLNLFYTLSIARILSPKPRWARGSCGFSVRGPQNIPQWLLILLLHLGGSAKRISNKFWTRLRRVLLCQVFNSCPAGEGHDSAQLPCFVVFIYWMWNAGSISQRANLYFLQLTTCPR